MDRPVPIFGGRGEELGTIPLNFSDGDPENQIFEFRKKNKGIQQSHRPGEEISDGVNGTVDTSK